MRRQSRPGSTTFASKPSLSPVPDPLSLLRAFDSDANPTRPVRPSPLTASTIQGIPLDLLDRLRSFPLFQSAPDSFLVAVATHLRPQSHQAQDYILTEGDDAKAMYWVVRGSVRVTSRDGESTFAELKPGAFFGEIGVLMDIPRTATIIAKMKSLVVKLNKEDLQKLLPQYPDIEQAIRDEAKERLAILEKKKKESGIRPATASHQAGQTSSKRPRDRMAGDVEMGDAGILRDGEIVSNKRRKSPSPGLAETAASSALGSGPRTVRQILKEFPLFSGLPPNSLHFLGIRAQPRTYPPFTDIIEQDSHGRDVFFIVNGEVEVVADRTPVDSAAVSLKSDTGTDRANRRQQRVVARLKTGQYFGEVASLSLAPRRTATVRSVASVECLMISGDVLTQLWEQFPPGLRHEFEVEAKSRLKAFDDLDIPMKDALDGTPAISELEIADAASQTPRRPAPPSVTLSESGIETKAKEEKPVVEPFDPDPYLNVDLDNIRSKSRRSSIAPPTPTTDGAQTPGNDAQAKPTIVPGSTMAMPSSPLKPRIKHSPSASPDNEFPKRQKSLLRRPSRFTEGLLPDTVLIHAFKYLDVYDLMRLRLVSSHWLKLLSTSPDILEHLDLTKYNRFVTDQTLAHAICPFVGHRPRAVDISNCFHVTDEGFGILASTCGAHVRSWKMKSVWDITGQAVLELVNKARNLEEIDLSNCRKVGDNLLARVVGWIVPDMAHQQQQQPNGRPRTQRGQSHQTQAQQIAPGTVVGCPRLTKITLSYCKHITDRSMAHLAVHAASRLEAIDLTRCTTITDQGFQHWSVYRFPRLHKLCLADCTYLSDQAIVSLTNAARGLRELDLSFCCALSDTATEVLSLGCPNLTHLNLAFCGSAVSDAALRCIGLHLLELRELSVRGCVRVTGVGVEAVIDGCNDLEAFDVSQCKNLTRWLDAGGVQRKGRCIRFETVADGRWRVHQ